MNRCFKAGSRQSRQYAAHRDRPGLTLEIAVKPRAVARTSSRISAHDLGLFATISIFGLLPVGLVCGLMLMQIFGVWSY
jgi:hypothetical protein